MSKFLRKGQSIIEILIAVAVGALLVVGAASILAPVLRVNTQAGQLQAAAALGKQLVDNVRVWAEADWHNIANLATSSANIYYLNTASSPFSAVPGSDGQIVSGIAYTRSFYVDDVQRDAGGNIVSSGGSNDPSTKKITIQYATGGGGTLGSWANTVALPAPRNSQSSILNNGYVYEIGGQDSAGFATSSVVYARFNADGSIGNWSSTTALPAARENHPSVVNNGYVYAIGGVTSAAITSSVVYAPINTDGTIGNWTLTTALPVARDNHTSIVNNGYVYAIGGDVPIAGATSSIVYAPINADGSLGSWTTTALPSVRDFHSSLINNGYVYAMGGGTPSPSSSVIDALINGNGLIGNWASTAALPTATFSHSSILYNGYVYVIGGQITGPNPTSSVYYALINANGSLGSWATATTLPVARYVHTSVANNGYVYVIGGAGNAGPTSSVIYAPIAKATNAPVSSTFSFYITRYRDNVFTQTDWSGGSGLNSAATTTGNQFSTSTGSIVYASTTGSIFLALPPGKGSLGSWAITSVLPGGTGFPSGIGFHSAAVYNGYIYTTGGSGDGGFTPTSSVFFAPLNSTGSVGTWANTTKLPTAITLHSAFAYNGHMYVAAGSPDGGSTPTSTVLYAPINSTGSIGAWSNTTALKSPLYYQSGATYNGYIYMVAGFDANSVTSGVSYAQINTSTGAVGAWTNTTPLPTALYNHSAAAYNGYLYSTGGFDGSVVTSTVFYAQINTSTGGVGAWSTTTPLPNILATHSAVAYNGYIYITGGDYSVCTSTVFYAPINSTGSLGAWISTSWLPNKISYHSAVANNGYLYSTGGYDCQSGTGTSTVSYAKIN